MARNIAEAGTPPPHTEGRVVLLSSFLERPDGRFRRPIHAGGVAAEPHRMVMLAEQAHQADQIEQAESLIEEVYAIYDQCFLVADGGASFKTPSPGGRH